MLVITVVLGLVSVGYVFAAATAPAVTGVFNPTPPGQCDINMKAWGAQDTGVDMRQSSAITVNNLTYVDSYNGNTAYRGFDVVTLDFNTCKAANFDHFDTFSYSSDADNLSKYIYGLSDGTHILGVTSYDGFNNLNPAAKAALRAIGVDVTGLEIYGKLIFHAIAGKPEKTKVKTSKAKEGNLFYEEKSCHLHRLSKQRISESERCRNWFRVSVPKDLLRTVL